MANINIRSSHGQTGSENAPTVFATATRKVNYPIDISGKRAMAFDGRNFFLILGFFGGFCCCSFNGLALIFF